MPEPQLFEARVAAYFADRLGYEAPEVFDARRLTGGVSRETWGLRLRHGQPQDRAETGVILRLDPRVSLLPSNRHAEFALFRAFASDNTVPVPRAICVEDDPAWLGTTFMATEFLPGTASISAIATAPFQRGARRVGVKAFQALAHIARFDWRSHGLAAILPEPAPDQAWAHALDHWEKLLTTQSLGPAPVLRMAVRALRQSPPPSPPAVTIVHGDYRLGNVLYTEDGELTAVLDWEMAHLGDPIEDLAWALSPKWRPRAATETVFASLDPEEAIAIFEDARGEPVDREVLRWWALFTRLKSAVLANSAGYSFLTHEREDIVQCIIPWHTLGREDRDLLHALGRISS